MGKRIVAWVKSERSVSDVPAVAMLILFGLTISIGLGWLVAHYLKPSATQSLETLTDVSADGIDPETPPHVVDGWQ